MAEFWEQDPLAQPEASLSAPQPDQFWKNDPPVAPPRPPDFSNPGEAEAVRQSTVGRVMSAMGAGWSGAKEGWGSSPLGMSDKDVQFMQEHGMFRSQRDEGVMGVFRAVNETMIYNGAKLLDAAVRTPNAVYHALGDAAMEAGVPRDVVAMPEAFFGSPHPMGVPGIAGEAVLSPAQRAMSNFDKEAAQPRATIGVRPTGQGEFDVGAVDVTPRPLNPEVIVKTAKDLEVVGPQKPEPAFTDSPSELAERAVPHALSSDVTAEQRQAILGHEPGEYDARGKEWIDKIDEPGDVREAIANIAAENDFFPEARGGVASVAARDAVAEAAGVHPSEIDDAHFSTHFDSDGKVRAVIQALRQTASDFADASKKAREEPTTENLAAAAEAELRSTHVMEYTLGLRAESGRTLAAWKDLLKETEHARAKVALKTKEGTGEATIGTTDVLDAAKDVKDNLKNPDKAPNKKPGLQRLVETAQGLVDNADKPPVEGRTAPLSPEVKSLVDAAKDVLDKFGAGKDAELEAFEQELTRLSSGEGKLGDTVDAARELLKKNEKPKKAVGVDAGEKVASTKAKLMGAAKRLVDAADNAKPEAKTVAPEMRDLMDTARQATGLLKQTDRTKEIEAFREALRGDDPKAAAEAAKRLIETENKKPSEGQAKQPVEYDKIMSAARSVAKATEEAASKEKPSLPPDVADLVENAKDAAAELKGERKSELGRLIDAAEKQAVEMTKRNPTKNPAEALPPELQALVDKAGRVTDRFGGIARGERAALLLARTGRTFAEQEELARSVAGLTPNQVAKVLAKLRSSPDANKPGWFYWLWQQGLISGLVTHAKYFAVNTGTLFLERTISPLVAAVIGKARGEQVSIGAPLYANIAMLKALPDALSSAAQAFKTGVRVPLASEMRLFERGEESPQTKGAASAYMQTQSPDWGIWNRVFNETQLDNAAKVLGIPGRSANMIHTFYKVLSERASASSRAFETAAGEGAKGDAFWQRYQYHVDNPTDEALRDAVNDAYTGAFMAKLGPKLTEVAHTLSKNPVTKWLFPFQHIPWNIESMTIKYSPFAVLGPEMRSAILGEKGAPAQNLALAKMAIGSSVIGYFMHKALSGEATGDYPTEQKEQNRWKLLGIEPNSIQIGGRWVSVERLGPIGNIAHIGASIGSIIQHYNGQDDDSMTKAIWAASVAAANQVGNEVGFQSLRNLIDAMEDRSEGKNRATQFVAYQAGTAIPFSSFLTQNASIIDPYQRKANDLISGFKYRIPMLRETLLPKRDPLYGEPVHNPGYHSIDRTGPVNTDPIKAELDSLHYYPAPPPDRIGGVKLSPEQYDRYQTIAGAAVRSLLDAVVNSDGWYNQPPFAREQAIHRMIEAGRKQGQATMQMAEPTLLLQGMQQRLDYIGGKSPTARPKKPPAVSPALLQ